jgi:hypothetical protein
MGLPDLEYVSRFLLKAIDSSAAVRERYAKFHPKELAALALFRKEFGETCAKVKGLLSLMWLNEITRDKIGFFADLRSANYGK